MPQGSRLPGTLPNSWAALRGAWAAGNLAPELHVGVQAVATIETICERGAKLCCDDGTVLFRRRSVSLRRSRRRACRDSSQPSGVTPWAASFREQTDGIPIALIVEDDPDLRELAAALLEESELRVVECESAEEAMSALVRDGDDVALVFADIRLPGLLDGVDLARRVKVLWPQITHDRHVGLCGHAAAGAAGRASTYMPKPWLALDVLMQAERGGSAGCSSSPRADHDRRSHPRPAARRTAAPPRRRGAPARGAG